MNLSNSQLWDPTPKPVVQEQSGEWVSEYLEHRYPALRPRNSIDPILVEQLFRKSGYSNLRSGSCKKSGGFQSINDNLSGDVVHLASDGSLTGHVSVTRAYPNTWLGHQLATLRHHPEATESRLSLYLFFASFPDLIDGPEAMMIGYYNRNRHWHQRMFEAFADEVADQTSVVTLKWDRFEKSVPSGSRRKSPSDRIEVRKLRSTDIRFATQFVQQHLPKLAIDALAIYPSTLVSSCLHPAYAYSNLDRRRNVYGLWFNGALHAVALCETGPRELSRFNLLNVAQIYMSDCQKRLPSGSIEEFIEVIDQFYKEQGINDPIFVAPHQTFKPPIESNMQFEESMGCIIWSGRALKTYSKFVQMNISIETDRNTVSLPLNDTARV